MERFIGPWDSRFHIRPELTDEEKLDILNSGKKMDIKRNELIEKGYIVDIPLVSKRNYKKEKLSREQIESLKATEKIVAEEADGSPMDEKVILKVLRKKYKKYKPIETIKIGLD